jgi:hypothetical protein
MKVNEFIQLMHKYGHEWRKFGDIGNYEILIVTKDKSIGPISSVQIDSVSVGFDWDMNTVLIRTEPAVRKLPLDIKT